MRLKTPYYYWGNMRTCKGSMLYMAPLSLQKSWKKCNFEQKQICNNNFWVGSDSPTHLETFQKFTNYGMVFPYSKASTSSKSSRPFSTPFLAPEGIFRKSSPSRRKYQSRQNCEKSKYKRHFYRRRQACL